MKNILKICSFALLFVWGQTHASGDGHEYLYKSNHDLKNQQSLQRGAKYFMNYCLACHSVKYMRYNRVGKDLGLTDEQVAKNLIFTQGMDGSPSKTGDLITNALPIEQAKEWFGTAPPDLSLTGRLRGADWIYSYLKSFYLDDSPGRLMGVNNLVFPNVAMPHVLADLQGWNVLEEKEVDGHTVKTLKQVERGSLSPNEYDAVVRDLTNFLMYIGDPIKTKRHEIGIWVLLYLGLLFIFAYFLKKAFWREIH